ncbi:Phosphate import ATP-binding protein PstB [Desulfamplus magnetovallimortis]|uniref:Phosphate import ATP-binding protein PstB n=1 Tax=Desulfamplus magnetovallimortis TaxID=1246637 RepID=A0A1W1HG92_9BACT|nr:phosphate ABC transporter ATP-binding protein [Desulfamplus magnetovallimortis]SLM31408.1 Phosphate import ATP-binding protein PstB [Desulfamplus magnetovallimortis]
MVKIKVENLTFAYNDNIVIDDVSAEFEDRTITAITGPSGKGKSTFLTVINRLWENRPNARMVNGKVSILFGTSHCNIYDASIDLSDLRRKVGMVFQAPNPLPMSIHKNVCFPLKLQGYKKRTLTWEKMEKALQQAFLWDEVKDRLMDDARSLSGGQQQRLCIARALILEPEVLLLDEPTASLDATASGVIEELLLNLKESCTILMVSHYLDQVKRVADRVMELSENRVFAAPRCNQKKRV